MKHPYQRVGVFVDVQNLYYSARALYGSKVNFSNLLEDAVSERQLIRAIAYVVKTDLEEEKAFFEALSRAGFQVRTKDLQIFPDGTRKANWDVGIAMDIIKMAPKLDVVVLVSGDGDFVDLIEYLKNHGHLVEVMAFGRSTSNKLKEVAELFHDLDQNPDRYLLSEKKKKKTQNKTRNL
jgi:uncharacterized LabA/DUF88 family protein